MNAHALSYHSPLESRWPLPPHVTGFTPPWPAPAGQGSSSDRRAPSPASPRSAGPRHRRTDPLSPPPASATAAPATRCPAARSGRAASSRPAFPRPPPPAPRALRRSAGPVPPDRLADSGAGGERRCRGGERRTAAPRSRSSYPNLPPTAPPSCREGGVIAAPPPEEGPPTARAARGGASRGAGQRPAGPSSRRGRRAGPTAPLCPDSGAAQLGKVTNGPFSAQAGEAAAAPRADGSCSRGGRGAPAGLGIASPACPAERCGPVVLLRCLHVQTLSRWLRNKGSAGVLRSCLLSVTQNQCCVAQFRFPRSLSTSCSFQALPYKPYSLNMAKCLKSDAAPGGKLLERFHFFFFSVEGGEEEKKKLKERKKKKKIKEKIRK